MNHNFRVGDEVIFVEAQNRRRGEHGFIRAAEFRGTLKVTDIDSHSGRLIKLSNSRAYYPDEIEFALVTERTGDAPMSSRKFKVGDIVMLSGFEESMRANGNWHLHEQMRFRGSRVVKGIYTNDAGVHYVKLRGSDENYHEAYLKLSNIQVGTQVTLSDTSQYKMQEYGIGEVTAPYNDGYISSGDMWFNVRWENGTEYCYPSVDVVMQISGDGTKIFTASFKMSSGKVYTTRNFRAKDEVEALRSAEVYMFQNELSNISSIEVFAK